MFADPQALTIGTALSLPRTGSGNQSGIFQTSDSLVSLSINHQIGKRTRRVIRVDHNKVAADPLVAAQNLRYNMACYFVVDVPPQGYTIADQLQVITGLTGNLAATSNANWNKFLGGES